jgi:transcriptional regulator with XRE-family HTH domain
MEKTIHQGHNVKRIREISGIKQESLALQLGLSQQAISQIEQKEVLDSKILEDLAKALNIAPEVIKNMTEDAANNFINTFNDQSGFKYQCTFNPLDKYIEAIEANKELYERLLKFEQEKSLLLEKLIFQKP